MENILVFLAFVLLCLCVLVMIVGCVLAICGMILIIKEEFLDKIRR